MSILLFWRKYLVLKSSCFFPTSILSPGSAYLLILQISSPHCNTLTLLDEPGQRGGSSSDLSPDWTGLLTQGHVMRNSGPESRALELFLLIFSPGRYTELPNHLLQETAASIKEIWLTQCLNQSYRYYLSFLFKVRSRTRICLENYGMGLNTWKKTAWKR